MADSVLKQLVEEQLELTLTVVGSIPLLSKNNHVANPNKIDDHCLIGG